MKSQEEMGQMFEQQFEAAFATAIFELGLKHSSPKVLIPLMPTVTELNTEHIKSHLQKYRIHHQRNKNEFIEFYDQVLKEKFVWNDVSVKTGFEDDSDNAFGEANEEKDTEEYVNHTDHTHKKSTEPTFKSNVDSTDNDTKEYTIGIVNQANGFLDSWKQHCDEVINQSDTMNSVLKSFVAPNG